MRSIFASRKGKLSLKHASEEPRYTLNGIYIDRSGVSVKPGTPRNTPEQPGTPRNIPGTPRNNPGTPLEHPIIPRNTHETARNTPGTPKIVVSGQTAHELTKPKTSEDSQFSIRLLRITLRFPSISRMLGIFSKLLRTAKKPLINGKNISCT